MKSFIYYFVPFSVHRDVRDGVTTLHLNFLCFVCFCVNFNGNQIMMEGQLLVYISGNNAIWKKQSETKN